MHLRALLRVRLRWPDELPSPGRRSSTQSEVPPGLCSPVRRPDLQTFNAVITDRQTRHASCFQNGHPHPVYSQQVGQKQSGQDRKSTRLNSSHGYISYAVFCLKKKKKEHFPQRHQLIYLLLETNKSNAM